MVPTTCPCSPVHAMFISPQNPAEMPFYESRVFKNGSVVDVPIKRNFTTWPGLVPGYTDQSCPTKYTSGATLFVGYHTDESSP